MAGEPLNSTQASGLSSDRGGDFAIASWRFPIGSTVLVRNNATGAEVAAVVTDRGPNEIGYPGHIFDVTPIVATTLRDTSGHNIPLTVSLIELPEGHPLRQTSNGVQSSGVIPRINTEDQPFCVSQYAPGQIRYVGQEPESGDKSVCVLNEVGEPTWQPRP